MKTDQTPPASAAENLPILKTKLQRPAITSDILPRDRLLQEFQEGLERPLTLISAPAGYGKSTLASRWLENSDCPGAWISLDENDNDPRRCLSYLVAAIQGAFPESCRKTELLLKAPTLPPASFLGASLLNDLDELDRRFILVLDDYHRIHEQEIHDLMAALLLHPSPFMHLVFSTRRDPPLPLSRLRAQGLMTEVTTHALRFTETEAEAFLKTLLNGAVTSATAANLNKKTEGWVAGLRLAALSLRNENNIVRVLAEMKGGFYGISQYLVQEVLSHQTPEIARYLMETSILDRFCEDLCEAVHESVEGEGSRTSGKEFINWLQTGHLFVIAIDLEHRWFRYHHLFQELLRSELGRRQDQKEISALHERASAWFVEEGLIEEAIEHSLKAGDIVGAADIVERFRDAEFMADRWSVVESWLANLPVGIKQERPKLLLTEAWICNLRYEMERLPMILEQVESLLGSQTADPTILGEIAFFRGYFAYFEGQAELSVRLWEEALSYLKDKNTPFLSETEMMLGFARCMDGKVDLAVRALKARISGVDKSECQLRSRLIASLVFIYLLCGDLPRVRVEAERLQLLAKSADMSLTEAWSYYMAGNADLHSLQLEAAENNYAAAVELKYVFDSRASIDAFAGLALTLQLMGREEEATAAADQLQAFAKELGEPQFLTIADSCRSRISLLQGDLSSAIRWARSAAVTTTVADLLLWLEVPAITRIRILIAVGNKDGLAEASELLSSIRRQSEAYRFDFQAIEIAVLQALAMRRQGQAQASLDTLKEALALAEPGGWIRPFIEAGTEISEMLKHLTRHETGQEFAHLVLEAFEDRPAAPPAGTSPTGSAISSPTKAPRSLDELTQREFDVLELLAQRLQNKEIGERLYISTHTVNYHLKHIYDKLGVHGRRPAVDRAVKLGILQTS